jgi:hypothetical protein
MPAAALAVAPRHLRWFAAGYKSHRAAQTPALDLIAHVGFPPSEMLRARRILGRRRGSATGTRTELGAIATSRVARQTPHGRQWTDRRRPREQWARHICEAKLSTGLHKANFRRLCRVVSPGPELFEDGVIAFGSPSGGWRIWSMQPIFPVRPGLARRLEKQLNVASQMIDTFGRGRSASLRLR